MFRFVLRLTLICLMMIPAISWSTHIVGGDIYYKHLGGTQYEINVKVYMDCKYGNPDAIQSDRQIFIGQYDAGTNNFERVYSFYTIGNRNLDDAILYACAEPNETQCVVEYQYRQVLSINPGYSGKILAFQRCCRNNSITNLYNPGETGATYWVKIPGTDVTSTPNSSAVFNNLPPNYVCIDAPFQFDHSASDPDGDSLIYELYMPYQGADKDDPRPSTPSNPPYQNIQWANGFNTVMQMTSDPLFKIDRFTGEVNAYPTRVGQYVVGIKVKEFRNEVLIGETMRDYQINVLDCEFKLISDFAVANASVANNNLFICTDSVQFNNQSYKAETYLWDFGDPTRTDDVSTEANPYWIYPGNGEYRVTLVAENSECIDSIKLTVNIRSDVVVDLGPDEVQCHNVYKWLDAGNYSATDWQWNTGRFGPTLLVEEPGEYSVQVFYGKCVGTDTVNIYLDTVPFQFLDDSLFCDSVNTSLSITDPNLDVTWLSGIGSTERSIELDEPGTYLFEVENQNGCTRLDSVRLWVASKPEIGDSFFFCNEFELPLSVGPFEEATYLWSNGVTSNAQTLTQEGEYWVRVYQRYCQFSDTIKIKNPVIDLELGPDVHFCDDVYMLLEAPVSMESYQWNTGDVSQNIEVEDPGFYKVVVTDTFGCVKSDSLLITLSSSPGIFIGNDTSVCVREKALIGLHEDVFVEYDWSTGEKTPLILVEHPDQYVLEVTDDKGCKGRDSMVLIQDPEALPNDLYIPNAFSPNDDNINNYFPYSFEIYQPEYHCSVYNRWGEKVFDSKRDGTTNWNGYYKDQLAAGGPFVYLVVYRACNGEPKVERGTLTMTR